MRSTTSASPRLPERHDKNRMTRKAPLPQPVCRCPVSTY